MWQVKLCVALVLGFTTNDIAGSHLGPATRILEGDEVEIEQYPHQVSVVYKGKHSCGGSIISEEYVLTAAHCVENKRARDFQVRAGSTYRTLGGELYDVENVESHAHYNLGNKFDYDIAVMRIAGRIRIDGYTTNIVQLADADSVLRHGEFMIVTGWGCTTGLDDPSNVLKAASLPVVGNERCSKIWEFGFVTITDRMVCAGFVDPGPSTCSGDSGGPLIDNNFVQHGIVSFGSPYCQGKPTIFTSVAHLRDWIQWMTGV